MAPKRKLSSINIRERFFRGSSFVQCPCCQRRVIGHLINNHLDSDCYGALYGQLHPCNKDDLQLRASKSGRDTSDCDLQEEPVIQSSKNAENAANKPIEEPHQFEGNSNVCDEDAKGIQKSDNASAKTYIFRPVLQAPRGHLIIENFLSAEEESHLLNFLDTDLKNPWRLATFNGMHKHKAYGVITDLKRRTVKASIFDMPQFLSPILDRMRETPLLKSFRPNEFNSIEYNRDEGHWLKPHVDDRQLSGVVIVNLSLLGDCKMTYEREKGPREHYKVLLKQRSLQILSGECRYNFTHSILNEDLLSPRRVSMTFRQTVFP